MAEIMADTANQETAAPAQEETAGVNTVVNDGDQKEAEPVKQAAQPDVPAQQATGAQPIRPEDVQGLVTRESRKALEKLLKDAGIQPAGNPEMQLKDYKKWLDSQKTELERAQGDAQAATTERDEARAELAMMKNTIAAVQKGIPADRASRYLKLAETYMEDGRDLLSALDAALADFPLPKPEEPAKPKDIMPAVTVPAKREDGDKRVYVPPLVI